MVKKVIELEVDIKGLGDEVKDIREMFADLKGDIEEIKKSAKKTSDGVGKGFKGLTGIIKQVKNGFSGLGLAIKTLGIGLVLEAFNTFKQVLGQNQVVADAFAIAFGAISNIFNDFVNFLLNNFDKAVSPVKEFLSSDTFKGVEDFFVGLITRVKNLIQGIGGLGKALVKVFKGEFGLAAVEAKNALDNFGDALKGNEEESENTRKVLKKVANTIKEVTTNAIEGAEAEVKLANAAKIAAAEQEKLRLENLKAAEEQRQIRDDVSKSIDDRIAANEELGKILEKGIQDELKLAAKQREAAEAALANNETNIDLQAELIRAQAAELEIQERIGGLRSEQLTNETSLLKEKLDLTNSISQSDSEATLRQLEGQLLLEDGILDRLELERQVAEEQKNIAEEQFKNTVKLFGEGTIEYENALKEQTAAQETYSNINKSIKKKEEEAKLAIVSEGLAGLSSLLGQESAAGKAVAIAQSIINTYQGATKALAQGGIFGAISAAGVIATGLANVKKIVATKIPGAEGSSGAAAISGVGGQIENVEQNIPDFNVVGASPLNQIAASLNNSEPQRAYVVSSDVTTAQQLERNIITESGI